MDQKRQRFNSDAQFHISLRHQSMIYHGDRNDGSIHGIRWRMSVYIAGIGCHDGQSVLAFVTAVLFEYLAPHLAISSRSI